jgi:hypothetical protein
MIRTDDMQIHDPSSFHVGIGIVAWITKRRTVAQKLQEVH